MTNVKYERIQCVRYIGTIESYNQMVGAVFFNRERFRIYFMDKDGKITNRFTGDLLIQDVEKGHTTFISPGNFYQITDESKFIKPEEMLEEKQE